MTDESQPKHHQAPSVNIWIQSAAYVKATAYRGEWATYSVQLAPYLEWLGQYAPVELRIESTALQLVDLCLTEDWQAVSTFLLALEADVGWPADQPSPLFLAVQSAVGLMQADPPPKRPEGTPQLAGVSAVSSSETIPEEGGSSLPAGVPRAPRVDPAPRSGVDTERIQQGDPQAPTTSDPDPATAAPPQAAAETIPAELSDPSHHYDEADDRHAV